MTADPTTTEPTTPDRSRRQVLCGLMVALLAPGALAACSTETPSSGGPTPTTGGGGGGASPAPNGALAALADVPDGGGLVVEGPDTQILLVRAGEEVTAYNPACPHQGTTVGPPQDGVITCPNHGSTFDAGTGEVTRGPATAGLSKIPIKVEGGNITLA